MNAPIAKPESIASLCLTFDFSAGFEQLTEKINLLMPELQFTHVVTRGNWYRLGGVVDGDYKPISQNIAQWAEESSGGDVDNLIADYIDCGYFATRLAGKTHYFTAPCGEGPEQFIQLEIEELQEVLDRPLVDGDWFPESLEEFLDPLDYPRLEPEPIGSTYLQFRRITPIESLLKESSGKNRSMQSLSRFFNDWHESSAGVQSQFCNHWILALREYQDRDGEHQLSAKPYSTFSGELKVTSLGDTPHGSELANAIHGFDRQVGYPFAWFFNLLSSKSDNYKLAEEVLKDQMGAFDYLPPRDLKVLRAWESKPYGV
ncbi:MAG: hypothetical protein KUF72_13880 [Candidatus Thiodiazotropha sp. (ex Ctena orbiculata)]|nr:hypothetical protein [Candidatus Thiodiazotropha taylori]